MDEIWRNKLPFHSFAHIMLPTPWLSASLKSKTAFKSKDKFYVFRKGNREVCLMENETHASKIFKLENCRAKHGAADLVDCLSPEQAKFCDFSLPFGNGYFCKHPRRKEIIENTQTLRSKVIPPPNVSQFDNQA